MKRRIIGQCNQADFASMEHLASEISKGRELDTSTLNRKEILACRFAIMCRDKGIPWKLLRSAVREVLFWGDGDQVKEMQVKFFPKPKEVGKFQEKWHG